MTMTIKKKLFSLYGLAIALTVVMGISSIYLFEEASTGMQKLVKSDSIKLGMAGELDAIAANIVSS